MFSLEVDTQSPGAGERPPQAGRCNSPGVNGRGISECISQQEIAEKCLMFLIHIVCF